MIKIKNISKRFGKTLALDNVSFEVEDGEIVGLLGENGAGKSTLLRILSTMLIPCEGNAEINGYDLLKNADEVRKNIGILFGSEVGLYERLTARENLEYFAKLNGMSPKSAKERADELAERFSFSQYQNKQVGTLSKGMKQKVAIARSIIHDPSVMLFDEPDSGLDFKAAKTIFDFMETCKAEGKSIIFSSHSMENIKNYSDRMVVIHKGKIVKTFVVEEYMQKYSEREINNILFNLVCGGEEDV
ncbi:MAG: ATP-binding cassette domain-containing protein [Clostridia bacterium]|nr:ATP-binding cassette domain-containing protein [Clostridia bacterium]